MKYKNPKNGAEVTKKLKKGNYYFQVADIGNMTVGEFIKGVGTTEDDSGNVFQRYKVIKANFLETKEEMNVPLDHFEGETFTLNDPYVGLIELRDATKDEVDRLYRYELLKGKDDDE